MVFGYGEGIIQDSGDKCNSRFQLEQFILFVFDTFNFTSCILYKVS